MMYYGPGMGGWTMALMIFGNVVFWAVLVLGAVVVARSFRQASPGGSTSSEVAPQQLLADRFARGEITEDDYLRSLRVLSDTSRPPLR
jgi:putative membrane protein